MHKSIFLTTSNTASLENLNLDSIFVLNPQSSIKHKNVETYAVFNVFAGEEIEDAAPVEAFGKLVSGRYCPTHPQVREKCLDEVRRLLALDINGIWLDSLSYATKWNVPEVEILDTCYCDRCLALFAEYIGEPISGPNMEEIYLLIDGSYYIEWLEFKALQITSMVKAVKDEILASGKDVKLGFFAIPWEDKEYGAGIKRIVAQDFGQLTDLVDMVSPMLYHKMCGKDVEWIKEKVDYFWHLGKPFLPFVQTDGVSAEELKKALEYASTKPSVGVGVFFLEDLIKQPEKLQVAKEFFDK